MSRTPRTDARTRGVSLVEVSVVTVIIGLLTILIVRSMSDLSATHTWTRGQAKATAAGDATARAIEIDASVAAQVYDRASGAAWLALMPLQDPLAPGARLPVVTERGYFDVDPPSTIESGNALLLARDAGTWSTDVGTSSRPDRVRVDLLRLVLWHPMRRTDGKLDLSRCATGRLARLTDLLAIEPSSRRAEVAQRLRDDGVAFAYEPYRRPDQGLQRISASGSLSAPPTGTKLPLDAGECRRSVFAVQRVELCANGKAVGIAVPRYTRVDGVFPGGFEVKLDGPATGRLLLLRLVLALPGRRTNWAETTKLVRGGS